MDYSYYVANQYVISTHDYSAGDVLYFCSDGEIVEYNESDYLDGNSSLEEVLYRITNDYNRFQLHGTKFMSFAYYYSNDNIYFFNSNSIDYCGFSLGLSNVTNSLPIDALYSAGDLDTSLDELEGITNYYQFTGDDSYTNVTQGRYGNYQVTLSNNRICWFDYSNQKDGYANLNAIAIRGENYSIYDTCLTLYTSSLNDNLTFYYGNPVKSLMDSEYTRGYNAGTGAGYVTGYDTGFRNGQNSVSSTVQTQNAFSYIEGAFGVVNNVLSLEVLPNVTLGLCFSIPLVFIVIMTIFKLVRK